MFCKIFLLKKGPRFLCISCVDLFTRRNIEQAPFEAGALFWYLASPDCHNMHLLSHITVLNFKIYNVRTFTPNFI
jgi:hypothetical protein